MAEDSEGRETKLPSEFLTHKEPQNPFEQETWPSYNSPVESEIGSTELESDKEDEYMAELSRRMAQYMLQDDDNNTTVNTKTWGLSCSPISTLWSPLDSSHGSPEGPSMESSPPSTPVGGGFDISDGFFSKLEKTAKSKLLIQDCSGNQVPAPKGHRRKQRQSMKQRGATMAAKQSQASSSQAHPSLQEQANSAMKTVFVSGSSGTGVFLPRPMNPNPQTPAPSPNPRPPKKKGSSTVLIPMRVLQALQLHYDRMDTKTRQKLGGFPLYRELIKESMVGNEEGEFAAEKSELTAAPDMGLPQEWTY